MQHCMSCPFIDIQGQEILHIHDHVLLASSGLQEICHSRLRCRGEWTDFLHSFTCCNFSFTGQYNFNRIFIISCTVELVYFVFLQPVYQPTLWIQLKVGTLQHTCWLGGFLSPDSFQFTKRTPLFIHPSTLELIQGVKEGIILHDFWGTSL